MTTVTKTSSILAATALAAALTGGVAVMSAQADDAAKVHCMGVNACKGQSACKTATSSCKGQNACKGQGYLEMTAAQCKEAGGKVEGQ